MRVIVVGRFDGVHRGHQALLSQGRDLARREGLSLCAYTFPPKGEALLPLPAKLRLLERLCDEVIVRPWEEVEEMTPEEFVQTELVEGLAVRWVVCGPNHRFGKGASGDVALLRALGRKHGFSVQVVEPLTEDGELISSRSIRALVREGRVEEAAALLGRPHVLFGRRVSGAGLGSELGFPTVNLSPWPGLVPPRPGVYAAWAHWEAGGGPALFYRGSRPTFPHLPPSWELHFLSPPQPEPQGELEVALYAFIRPEARFATPAELTAAMERDLARAKELLSRLPPPPRLVVSPGRTS
ncbi:hypothetical protein LR090_07285 [Candidatus Bipolaricaulota bacterium]|nr:hypothetical protein [Candidatus Bipolaricaulota bacterium]